MCTMQVVANAKKSHQPALERPLYNSPSPHYYIFAIMARSRISDKFRQNPHLFRQNPTNSDIRPYSHHGLSLPTPCSFQSQHPILSRPTAITPSYLYRFPKSHLTLLEVLAGAMRGWLNIPMTGFGRFKLSRQDTHTLPTVGTLGLAGFKPGHTRDV